MTIVAPALNEPSIAYFAPNYPFSPAYPMAATLPACWDVAAWVYHNADKLGLVAPRHRRLPRSATLSLVFMILATLVGAWLARCLLTNRFGVRRSALGAFSLRRASPRSPPRPCE